MKSLIIVVFVVSVAAAAEKNARVTKDEKREISSFSNGAPQTSPTPHPSSAQAQSGGPTYQPNYLPTCVVQPYGNPVYSNPPVYQQPQPYYNAAAESYVPATTTTTTALQYHPPQYPVAAYQPPQYPVAAYQPPQYPTVAYQPPQYPTVAYQPSQYPTVAYQSTQYPAAAYQQSQYPLAYQPQQPTVSPAAPYSYSYFSSSPNNNAAVNTNAPTLSTKK